MYHFKGDMEMLTLSGIECADKERPGFRMPVDLALRYVDVGWERLRREHAMSASQEAGK
jgi:hypothetical protein